jgi:hypothetical protein
MARKQTVTGVLLLATSMLAGGLASVVLAHKLVDGETDFGLLPLVLGAVFGGLGWMLPETIIETVIFLLITGVMGAVALVFLQSETLRIVVIAFLCGFNVGKLAGSIYREVRD